MTIQEIENREEIVKLIKEINSLGPMPNYMKEVIVELWDTPNTEYLYELKDMLKDVLDINKAA